MRAAAQPSRSTASQPHHVMFRGNAHERPPPSRSPFPAAASSPYTPSPSSSSSASSSSHRSSSSSGSTSVRPIAVTPTLSIQNHGNDDSDTGDWASIRLTSSPPLALGNASATTRGSNHYGRESSFATLLHPRANSRPRDVSDVADTTAMLPLVVDDFSQDRMGRVPTARSTPTPCPPLAQQPKSSSWSIGRRNNKPETSSSSPLVRAQSLNQPQPETMLPAAHDITLMDHRVFVARDQWVPHRDRRACVVCDRDFGLLRKKHSCRMCGDVVCSRCSLFKQVKLPGVVGESKARVCSRCFLQYRQRVFVKTPSVDHADVVSSNDDHHEHMHNHDHDHLDQGDHDVSSDEANDSEEFAYDSAEELPSAEDVMRRTAAKMSGFHFPITPIDSYGGRPKPVSLLAPELMETMYRESATRATASSMNSNHIYGRGPSMVLLSPASCFDLLDMRLFDLDRTRSFSSSISTVSSSLSSLSSSSTASTASSSTRSATEEELAAAMRARELETEVEASRERIQELERKMQEQENKKTELSLEQQKQLSEARELIAQLQQQLTQQEQNAREAALARDSICLTNLRQMQYAQIPILEAPAERPTRHRRDSVDAESEALRQKLRLLERQLQHAGINVAEMIPYAIAKQRIIDISRRMGEISDAEAAMKLQNNAKGVVALRREYYVLEQDMERFHTALLMSDEYMEEQAAKEREWELGHALANAQALRLVRSALPVDISRLSEQTLRTMTTPSGKSMSADLARRFKRTNVLQLLRVSPQTIVRMHPSVIESYRTAGLTLIERRALHAALKDPASEWLKQARDEIAQKKASWFKKLKDAFMQALVAYEQHIVQHHMGDNAQCPFLGKMCVVRGEQAVAQLYGAQLGFPEGDEYFQQEIIKSDPEGAGEKALLEAKTQAMTALQLSARQSELKHHYGLRNVRLVTMALAALEEMDAAMERIRALDGKIAGIVCSLLDDEQTRAQWWQLCQDIAVEVRELTLQLARRTGVCLTGKRDRSKDDPDTRSPLEVRASHSAACYVDALVHDMVITIASISVPVSATQLKTSLPRIREMLEDVQGKNDALFLSLVEEIPLLGELDPVLEADAEDGNSSDSEDSELPANGSRVTRSLSAARVPWKERQLITAPPTISAPAEPSPLPVIAVAQVSPTTSPRRLPPSPLLVRGSMLLDAIRAKRSVAVGAANESSDDASPLSAEPPVAPAPAATEEPAQPAPASVTKAVDNAPKANHLFAAIRARQNAALAGSVNERANEVVQTSPAKVSPSIDAIERAVPEEELAPATVQKTVDTAPKANNLFAAIRAKRSAVVANAVVNERVSEVVQTTPTKVSPVVALEAVVAEPAVAAVVEPVKTTTDEAPKANNLLAAIRARKANKANAVSAVAPVDHTVSSA